MLRLTRLPNSPESPLLLLLNSAPPRLRRPLPVPLLSSVKALVAAPFSSIPHHSHPKPFSSPLRRLPPAMDLAGAFHAAAVGEASPPNPNPNVDPELHRLLGAEDASEGEAVASSFAPPSSSSSSGGSDGRRDLPEELAKGVVLLQCESSAEGGACDVYLVGTAHVSQESCKEVKAVINYLKPQVVFLELCASRVAILTPQNLQVPTVSEMIDMWKKKKMNTFGILYSWFLAKVASTLEVLPGSEFRVAFEEAMSYGGKVILGDRPVHITLRRTWGSMTLWHRLKFLYYILFQTIFLPSPEDLTRMLKEMDDVDILTIVIQEMSKEFPTLMETLLHERDMYMSSKLLKVASEHSSVVAVVGKGHLPGIKKYWKQPIKAKDLLEIPTRSSGISRTKILTSLGVAVTGSAIASGLYFWGRK
ncbi:Uncharacterized protein ACMD2_13949 [Ananas comosus]|uniref:TraB domain-containing protein n=1 Tax=Ananas comosus TaxID=4615 RepID=A0A199UJF6_ANACO|nr:Uncharacterized protein ACMD2_13949 [Ananas comosus]